MLTTLVMAAALLQGQGVIVRVPAQQYRIPVQPVQAQPILVQSSYYQVYPQPQIRIQYYQPLRPGDIVINQRIGLFGWRKEARIYRKLR